MTTVSINQGFLYVEVLGFDKVLALKSRLQYPLHHVRGAEMGAEVAKEWVLSFRVGSNIPGVVKAGTFLKWKERAFFDVHHYEKAIAITLIDEGYTELIIEVENPQETIGLINKAIGKRA